MNIFKGLGAIMTALVFIIVTHNGTDLILEKLGVFTPPTVRFDTPWMLVTAIVYRNLFLVVAGYLAAAIAPEPKMGWVVALAVIGTLLGVAGVFVAISYDLGPVWYPIALVLLGFPCVWVGGMHRTRTVKQF
jgi:hypothetical protein